jgi:thioesterase domain-containing protein
VWQPLVTGRVDDYHVDCEHGQMTTPEALSVVGPVLEAALAKSAAEGDAE